MNSKRPGKAQNVGGSLPPLVPALASLIVPGLGQLLNRQKLKALLWFMVPVLLLTIEFSSSQWGRYLALVSGRVPEDAIASTRQVSSELTLTQASDENVMATLFGAPEEVDSQQAAGDGDPFAEAAEVTGETSQGSGDPFAEAAATEETGDGSGDPFADAGDSSGSTGESYFTQTYRWPDYRTEGPHYPIRDFGGFFTRGLWGLFTLGRLRIGDSYGGTDIELFNKISPWMTADNSIVLLGNGLIALMVLIIFLGLWALGVADAYGSRKRINATGHVERFGHFIRRVWDSLFVYIISAPSFALILMFTVIPILFTFLLALTDYTYKTKLGAMLINWVGFGTFRYLTLDPGWLAIFGNIFLWTVVWAFISSFTVYALGFFNAMVVESPLVKYKKFWRTIMILPWAIPALVSLMVFRNAFDKDGLINQFLFATGLMEPVTNFLYRIGLEGQPDQPIFWFQPIYNGKLARFIVVLVNLWLGAPYHMMMITGVLSTIPKELYEAAAIDGASARQRFRYITLPMVLSATLPALIMTFSFNFNNFGAVYFLTGGGPTWDPSKVPESMRILGSAMPGQTDILLSWIYKLSFTKGFEQFNVAAVYSIIIFMIVGAFSVFNLLRTKSFKEEAGE